MPKPTKYVSRSALGWGASPAGSANPRSGLVIHYDSANLGLATKPHTSCVAYWKNTRKFHTGPSRGWADIGYSFFACPHGYVLEGRGLYKTQAAQPGGNSSHYSCTLAGGPSENPTAAQIDAVRELRQWLMEPDTSISGAVKCHSDFISTSCPGNKARALVRNGTFSKKPGGATGQAPEEEDLMRHQRYTKTTRQKLPKGEWASVEFQQHNGGKSASYYSLAPDDALYDITGTLRLSGLATGDEFQWQFAEYEEAKPKWKKVRSRGIAERFQGDGGTYTDCAVKGHAGKDRRVRLLIKQWTQDVVYLEGAEVDVFYQPN